MQSRKERLRLGGVDRPTDTRSKEPQGQQILQKAEAQKRKGLFSLEGSEWVGESQRRA